SLVPQSPFDGEPRSPVAPPQSVCVCVAILSYTHTHSHTHTETLSFYVCHTCNLAHVSLLPFRHDPVCAHTHTHTHCPLSAQKQAVGTAQARSTMQTNMGVIECSDDACALGVHGMPWYISHTQSHTHTYTYTHTP